MKTFWQLRRYLDPKEPFTYRVVKPRSNDRKGVPDWALDDNKVRQLILTVFPKCGTNTKNLQGATTRHREGAAAWIRIIHLYWRMGKTEGQVADEMGTTVKAINHKIHRMRTVAEGLFSETPRHLNTRGNHRHSWGGRRPGAGRLRVG